MQDEMDSCDSEIIFLQEVDSKNNKSTGCSGNSDCIQPNGELLKDDNILSHNGEDMNEDVPDFDDLEVLDCWEEIEENNEEIEHDEPARDEPVSNSNSSKVHKEESGVTNATKSERSETPSKSSKGDETVNVGNLTALDKSPTANSNSKTKQTVKDTSDNALVKDLCNKKSGEKLDQDVRKESKNSNSPTLTANDHRSNTRETGRSSKRPLESSKDNKATLKKSSEKDFCASDLNLPTDATETKVDRFLKEMARQNPHIVSLKEISLEEKTLEPISSDSSKHSSIVSPPGVDPSDLPPGVDMDQVSQDTGTSLLLSSIRQSETQSSRGNQVSSRQVTRERADRINRENESRSRSPYSKNVRRDSSHESFSLSPSPSPRGRRLSPSSAPYPRVPTTSNYMASSMAAGFSDRPSYPVPPLERNRFHRDTVRDPGLRELSRSLSRERLRHRSRSRSRGRTYVRGRSRSRHRYSSKEEHYRRYRRSSSHSRSPTRRIRSRSRSRSQSRHQYNNKRSPMWDDEHRTKRPRMTRSRSRSPWKSHAEASSEWHKSYSDASRNHLLDEEVKLEHDMARFIATNIAATGLRPPGWFETGINRQDILPSNSHAVPEPPVDILDRGMPLPPPPPDISELMTAEEIRETKSHEEMSPVPAVSLSSLLESAVTGFPEKVIMDRCQDAIMKLHDVSIKPGRFAVISTIKVPQAEPSSTFQPWQSVLNRSLASKIHFTFSKLSEQPVYWKLKPIPIKTPSSSEKQSGSSSQSRTSSVSSTVDMDRSALLEKIFLLTRELQEVRRILDSKSSVKKDISVQTCFMNYCDSCGIEMDSVLPVERQSPKEASSSATSYFQSNSSTGIEPTRQPILEYGSSWLPAPPPQSVKQPQPVPAPLPVPPPQSVRLPQPVIQPPRPARLPKPAPAPLQVPPLKPVSSPFLNQNTSGSLSPSNPLGSTSLLGPPPIMGSSQTVNWCVTNQPGPSSAVGGATSSQSDVPLNSTAQQGTNQPIQATKSIPALMSVRPDVTKKNAKAKGVQDKTVPDPSVPKTKAAPALPAMSKITPVDYDITKYQMVGDEYMYDLIAYLRSVGKQINYETKFVSRTLNIDNLLKVVIGAGNTLRSQVILYFGMYNGCYSAKILCKFKQLIGYLKKRCSHLVVIEPPPIPKYPLCKLAWNSFNSLEQDFQAFKSENVSIVKVMPILLSNTGMPNNALFADCLRVGMTGLTLIAEELERVILAASKRK